jgi:hypothetical protein
MANLKLHKSCEKSGHAMFMCAHALESTTCRINPSLLLLFAYHCNNSKFSRDLYIPLSLLMRVKCYKTFMGTWWWPTCLYLALPHFGQWVAFAYCPLYNMHLKWQAWIHLYSNPSLHVNAFAWYIFIGKQFSLGSKNFHGGKKVHPQTCCYNRAQYICWPKSWWLQVWCN